MGTVLDLLSQATVVEPSFTPPISRDPKDDKFLAAARAAHAAYLVTEDQDLLVLEEYEGTAIVTAEVLLQHLHNRLDSEGNGARS